MMKLYTVATHNYGYYEALQFSAQKNKFKLINLAYDKKWKGLMWKFKLLLNKIENVDDNEIIAFCDGFDVIVVNSAHLLKTLFLKLDCDIIFGKENSNHNSFIHYLSRICFKNYHLLERNNIPNSGVYVGYAGKIKKFLKLCLKIISTENDDQDITYFIYYNRKKYDLNIKLFDEYLYTIPFNKDVSYVFSFNESRIKKITCDLNKVFFIHSNGNRNMDIYCKELNYPLKLKGGSKSNHSHIMHYSKMLYRNNQKKIYLLVFFSFFLLFYYKKN